MKEIRVKAEGYQLLVIDDTPTETSFRISHSRYGYANVHYWGNSKIKLLTLETESRNKIVDDAEIVVVNDIIPTWCYGLTQWGNNEVVEKVDHYKDSAYDTDLNKRQLIINEQAFELNDGKFLIKDFRKYGSGLLIISEKPIVTFYKSTANIGGTELEEIKGRFFTTKKGAKAFDTTVKNPTHILYKDGWGGCFNSYRGRKLPDGIYNHRASSNGGGAGYDYAVYELNRIPRPSIEDF
jgi:hypothetical protein